jgi:hypothetical protein
MNTQPNTRPDTTWKGRSIISMKPYAVVPWTNGTHALVDMVQYRRADDNACILESADVATLEGMMHRLNAKHMKALITDLRSARRISLDEDTMHMLTQLGESIYGTLEDVMNHAAMTPEKRAQARSYQEKMSTPSAVVAGLVRNVYQTAFVQQPHS